MRSTHYLWLAVAGLAIGIIGWLIVAPKYAKAPGRQTSTVSAGDVSIDASGGQATLREVASTPVPAMPALAFSAAGLGDDAKQALTTQWDALTAALTTSPDRVDLWLKLGTVYKIAGQYDAAIAAWDYVAHAGPSSINYIAYGNLGDLYLNFTHEYAKAAAAYRMALKGQSANPDYQAGLAAAQSHL
jgi:tetratricopeptide (TPR) repeat protein